VATDPIGLRLPISSEAWLRLHLFDTVSSRSPLPIAPPSRRHYQYDVLFLAKGHLPDANRRFFSLQDIQ
jgi:hypothetical protein